jgi:FkbM family methyltransferase
MDSNNVKSDDVLCTFEPKVSCPPSRKQRQNISIVILFLFIVGYFFNGASRRSIQYSVQGQTETMDQKKQMIPPHPTRHTYHINPLSHSKAIQSGRSKCHDVNVIGTHIKVCAQNMQHFGLFKDHIQRESDVYRLIKRVHKHNPSKAFVDVGSNHGIMSFFAAKIGAQRIIAVEPNFFLSTLILRGFQQNKMKGAELFNAACIDAKTNETVKLKDHFIAEGAIGTVVRGASGGKQTGNSIPAAPVAGFLPPEGGIVGVLKIDVEGHELSVMKSLINALRTNAWNIENIVIEFGPPSRWQRSSREYTAAYAVNIMSLLRDEGYEIHVMNSFAYGGFQKKSGRSTADNPEGMKTKPYGIRVDPLANGDWTVMDAMSACDCEAYLWLYKVSNRTNFFQGGSNRRWSTYSKTASSLRHILFWFWSGGGWMWCCCSCLSTFCFASYKAYLPDTTAPEQGGFIDSNGRRRKAFPLLGLGIQLPTANKRSKKQKKNRGSFGV